MKYNILICENEDEPMSNVVEIASDFFSAMGVEYYCREISDNFENISEYILKKRGFCNVYLLNINLKGVLNGLELASRIRKVDYFGYIIFITSYTNLAMTALSYRLKILDFINKSDEKFTDKLIECFETIIRESSVIRNEDQRVVIKAGSSYYPIILSDINFIETDSIGRKIIIHTSEKRIESSIPLKEMENELDSRFFRCHRGVIVNTDKIHSICAERKNPHIRLLNENKCPLSLRRVRELIECIDKKEL